MSSDRWCAKQLTENKSNRISLLNHANFKKYYLDKLNSKTEFGYLSAEAKNYYQQNVLHRVIPTLMLQLNTPLEDEQLQNMKLDKPEWGYLHAGAKLLVENGAKLDEMLLDDIITIGMLLKSLLLTGKTPPEYSHYFNLPAIIHNQLNPENKEQLTQTSEQESDAIYQQYFNYSHQFSQNNPFI
ncbi:hypothetical protein [Arsenophonus endosymbiont of Aleurodicus floccissimus]|uniref:hypothetical protein n=1 Tax=Arsenophonus endosymbiont of Aleurodicus floccissimus TaxID=2152761 RepID=UPI000E6AEEBA|nr:hypothetical protein [Arsenophonus endosymbiont of Aleurodicus floccissimus]